MRNVLTHFIVACALALAVVVAATAILRADGLPAPPPQGVYPVQVPIRGGPSCLMSASQLGYLTGRRDVAYAATEACMLFAGSRGAVLPYGFYGPYVSPYWQPPTWIVPPPY